MVDECEVRRSRRAVSVTRPRPDSIQDGFVHNVRIAAMQTTEQRPRCAHSRGGVEPRIVQRLVHQAKRTTKSDAQALEVAELDSELITSLADGAGIARQHDD